MIFIRPPPYSSASMLMYGICMACLTLRIEGARGIIRVLSGHLRARVWDLNDLRTRLEALEQSSEIKRSKRWMALL